MKLKRKQYSDITENYKPYIPKNFKNPNLIPSKINKEVEKDLYLLKLGARQYLGNNVKNLNPRFGKYAKLGDIIKGAGKYAYKQ